MPDIVDLVCLQKLAEDAANFYQEMDTTYFCRGPLIREAYVSCFVWTPKANLQLLRLKSNPRLASLNEIIHPWVPGEPKQNGYTCVKDEAGRNRHNDAWSHLSISCQARLAPTYILWW